MWQINWTIVTAWFIWNNWSYPNFISCLCFVKQPDGLYWPTFYPSPASVVSSTVWILCHTAFQAKILNCFYGCCLFFLCGSKLLAQHLEPEWVTVFYHLSESNQPCHGSTCLSCCMSEQNKRGCNEDGIQTHTRPPRQLVWFGLPLRCPRCNQWSIVFARLRFTTNTWKQSDVVSRPGGEKSGKVIFCQMNHLLQKHDSTSNN